MYVTALIVLFLTKTRISKCRVRQRIPKVKKSIYSLIIWQTSGVIRVGSSEPARRVALVSGPVELGTLQVILPVAVALFKVTVSVTVGWILVTVVEAVWHRVTERFQWDTLSWLADVLISTAMWIHWNTPRSKSLIPNYQKLLKLSINKCKDEPCQL